MRSLSTSTLPYFKYSSSSGNSLDPLGKRGPSFSRRPSQSNPLNQGCCTTCLNPFSNSNPCLLEPMRDSGPARRQDKKSTHSGDRCAFVSAGISKHCLQRRIFRHVVTGSSGNRAEKSFPREVREREALQPEHGRTYLRRKVCIPPSTQT